VLDLVGRGLEEFLVSLLESLHSDSIELGIVDLLPYQPLIVQELHELSP
jgi:hypothetical protein